MYDDGNWFCELFDGGKFLAVTTWRPFVAFYCRAILFDLSKPRKNYLITAALAPKND